LSDTLTHDIIHMGYLRTGVAEIAGNQTNQSLLNLPSAIFLPSPSSL
jgi:hypothetical protein